MLRFNKQFPSSCVMAAILLAGCGGGGNAPPAIISNADVQAGCASVAQLAASLSAAGASVAITSAALATTATADADGNKRSYCAVKGTINAGRLGARTGSQTIAQTTYAINFQINLPLKWNGRLFFGGGSGTNGSVPDTTGVITKGEAMNPLLAGYATVSDDSGHANAVNADPANGDTSAFGLDPQARLDFGYQSIGKTKAVANKLISAYYGKAQDYAYFVGCSEGGREAMMVTQRYPDEFDGVVAGNPGADLPQATVGGTQRTQYFAEVARAQGYFETTGPGAGVTPLLNAAFKPAQWAALQTALLAQCDAADGLVDGMINHYKACKFDAAQLACGATGAPADCLLPSQVTALQKGMAAARNSKGEQLYADWPWDAGIGAPGWTIWRTGFYATTGANNGISVTLGGSALPLLFTTPPPSGMSSPNAMLQYMLNYNMDSDAPKIFAKGGIYTESAMDFMGTGVTDLSAFKKRGGKLMVYHGQGDPIFSLNHTTNWFDKVAANTQANGSAKDFVRVFPVPGMNHCSGGPATDSFPVFTAVVDWVEKGKVPNRLIAKSTAATATANGWALPAGATVRTRPLCPYPQYARYTGATGASPAALLAQNDPASYVCTAP